jgi:hypothetical protein
VKRALAILGIAVMGSQAGHLLAYELRYGSAAQQVQSTGAHAYFPMLVRTVLGGTGLSLLAALLVIGFARLATGRRMDRQSAPSTLRLLAGLYTLQLGFFLAQETLEGSLSGQLLLWGLLGQLPVAFAGAVALRWLIARLAPAVASLRTSLSGGLQIQPYTAAVVLVPIAPTTLARHEVRAGSLSPRAPPRLLLP